jgi:hypothetical protein
MDIYKNNPTDLAISIFVKTYEKAKVFFDDQEKDVLNLHIMLALLGIINNKKIPLDTKDNQSDKPRNFSLRLMYQRGSTDFDTAYGLITILDNLDNDYNYVVNNLAFEKTERNKTPFLKMTNVRTFYEYMLSGLDYIDKEFFNYGTAVEDVADTINEFLEKEEEITSSALDLLVLEENEES